MVRYSIRLTDSGYAVYIAKFNKAVSMHRNRASAQRDINERYEQMRKLAAEKAAKEENNE